MNLGDWYASINRVQTSRIFKIVASVVVVVAAMAIAVGYAVAKNAPVPGMLEVPPNSALPEGEPPISEAERNAMEATAKLVNSVLAGKQDPTSIAVGCAAGAGLSLVVIWIGLGLTYLGLISLGAVLALVVQFVPWTQRYAPLVVGLIALTAAFTALLQALRIILSASSPVIAIARNTVAEAVRLKLSAVFIVMLIFLIASLPMMLDESQPLRYRVQSFLTYASGGGFWLIAILVVLFSAATVAFEQRDKVIWQTMTKPVAAAQYILGKWLGVVSLAAVLLLVTGCGIFLFGEYLRAQPAQGERQGEAYVAASGQGVSEDRRLLETQILTARVSRSADPLTVDEEQFEKNVRARVDAEMAGTAEFQEKTGIELDRFRENLYRKLSDELRRVVQQEHRSIAPGTRKTYRFSGLREARTSPSPITLRFKPNAGQNRPDELYKLTLTVRGGEFRVFEVPLGQFLTTQLTSQAIDQNGVIELSIDNGDTPRREPNNETVTFAPDALEISYSVGGYSVNFFRVMLVLWVKLAFLSMLAIFCSTFMSFPVACLVAFGVFIAGESGNFLRESLNQWSTTDDKDNVIVLKWVIEKIAQGVEWTLRTYADLRPTKRLVDGLLLSWSEVAWGTLVLMLVTAVLFVLGSFIFKRRQLAIYSGH